LTSTDSATTRTGAAGAGEAGNGRQQVQKQDSQLAHRRILTRSRFWQRMRANVEFAMDTLRTLQTLLSRDQFLIIVLVDPFANR
jgi:hypothetical protein